jgi:hypothetical protein
LPEPALGELVRPVTRLETRLRLALGRGGLPEPFLNPRTELRAGVVRQPDLAYPEYRVAVEYDGEARSAVAKVRAALMDRGWTPR